MRFTSHKTLMCNKLCNWVFCVFLMKRPALDALLLWTVRALWPVSERPESGRLSCSGRVGGAQILDALAGDESTWYGWDELAQEHNK